MSRKPGFPNSTCSIKLPDGNGSKHDVGGTDGTEENSYKNRQQLITFGHNQWGFNNWSWKLSKQDLDFVDFSNGKYSAGVAAFVCVEVKCLGIFREDVGYATCTASYKGAAIHSARKCSVTNALRETLLSFGGDVATSLLEQLESNKKSDGQSEEVHKNTNGHSNSQNGDAKNISYHRNQNQNYPQRKDSSDSSGSTDGKNNRYDVKSPQKQNTPVAQVYDKNPARPNQPVTETHGNHPSNQSKPGGPTANHPPNKMVPAPPPLGVRPSLPLHPSNVSYVVQRVMPPLYCATPPPYHNTYYTEYAPWPMTYDNMERHHTNVNLNYNVPPPKNFVVNGRPPNECSRSCNSYNRTSGSENESHGYATHPANMNGTWIKPTIFYDGFWTEQKVKKWVSEQNDRSPMGEDGNQTCHSKV